MRSAATAVRGRGYRREAAVAIFVEDDAQRP
jgi:hypothetical protein